MINKIVGKFFILIFFLLSVSLAFAQTITVSGSVKDENGQPLSLVSVTQVGGTKHALTDEKGNFTITVSDNAKFLQFSYTGKKDVVKPIVAGQALNVQLESSDSKLGDVVVIGYGTEKKANITSAISSLKADDIKNIPAAGVDQMMQGKIPGVTVTTNSGQPGGGVSVRVRGITTVSNVAGVSNEPLYVIDGVPIYSSTASTSQDQLGGVAGQTTQSVLATLNPSDIESIDVLKDASAQAIYGSAGANGVVLITTKKGKTGEGKISYDGYVGWSDVQKKLPLMDLRQYAQYYNSLVGEVGSIVGLDTIPEFANPSLLGKGTDWQDAIFQTGVMQNHQLSFSGGTGKTTYYFSGGYFDQTGTVIGSEFKRWSIRASVDQQVKKWLKAGVSANLSRTNQQVTLTDGQQSVISLALYNSPATPVKGLDGSYLSTSSIAGVPFGQSQNPVALALLRDVHDIQSKAYGNIYAEIEFIPGLTLRNQFNYDAQSLQNTGFEPSITNPVTNLLVIGPNRLRVETDNSYYFGLQTYLTYNHTFLGKHYLNVVVGHEASRSDYDSKYISATGTVLNQETFNGATIDDAQTGGNSYPDRSEGYFARLNYTYDNRYSISLSDRRDGSAKFGPNHRIGYFPAASAAWTVSNEKFAKNWSWVSNLKLRIGVGDVGYSAGNFAYQTNIRLLSSGLNGLLGESGIGVVGNLGNPDLHWEAVRTYNAGIDATLFKNHIDFTIDVYKKITKDLILATSLPSFAGLDVDPTGSSGPLEGSYQNIDAPTVNAGQMTNTGVDIGITTHNITEKNFTWTTNFVFSAYKNRLNSTAGNESLFGRSQQFTSTILTVSTPGSGKSVGEFYGYVTDGLYRSMDELNNGPVPPLAIGQQGTWLGDIRYKDLDGNDTINSKDQTYIGDPNPKFTYSITNTFNYKGFDLSIFLNGVYGDKIFNMTRTETEQNYSAYLNQSTAVLNRYSATNPNSSFPRYNQWNSNNLAISDRFVESGSYLRIQNISLGYNIPKKVLDKLKVISSFRVYVSGQNIHTFTKYSGLDPELGSFNGNALLTNVDYGHYPNPRTYTIGANIVF
ncbi:MAG: TonB-dependent receptor [Arachidicoccus sp.]|nr:TonB-dependent receptor [Arachidicoccus sp.]